MKPPKTSHDNSASTAESNPAWEMEQFSEPRTMPAHWDLSELMSPAGPAKNGRSGGPAQTAPLSDSSHEVAQEPPESLAGEDKTSESLAEWHKNMFTDPTGLPNHWDRSW